MENMFDLLDDWENLFYKMCQFYNISIKDREGNFKCLWEIFRELNENKMRYYYGRYDEFS